MPSPGRWRRRRSPAAVPTSTRECRAQPRSSRSTDARTDRRGAGGAGAMSVGPVPTGPLHLLSARALLAAIVARQVSAVEAMTAALERIATVNPGLGAIVTLDPGRAL